MFVFVLLLCSTNFTPCGRYPAAADVCFGSRFGWFRLPKFLDGSQNFQPRLLQSAKVKMVATNAGRLVLRFQRLPPEIWCLSDVVHPHPSLAVGVRPSPISLSLTHTHPSFCLFLLAPPCLLGRYTRRFSEHCRCCMRWTTCWSSSRFSGPTAKYV